MLLAFLFACSSIDSKLADCEKACNDKDLNKAVMLYNSLIDREDNMTDAQKERMADLSLKIVALQGEKAGDLLKSAGELQNQMNNIFGN